MKIRSLTLGIPTIFEEMQGCETAFAELSTLREEFIVAGFTVDNLRGSFEPVCGDTDLDFEQWEKSVKKITREITRGGGEFFAAPFWSTNLSFVEGIARVQRRNPLLFNNLAVIDTDGRISEKRVSMAATIIARLAQDDPFMNLRFCASAKVPPNTPFFPSSFQGPDQSRPCLSIALECADEVVKIVEATYEGTETGDRSVKYDEIAMQVQSRFEDISQEINEVLEIAGVDRWAEFIGIDFSPAPFPETSRSIAHALEIASGVKFGDLSMVGAISAITRGIKAADVQLCGFSGVMLPVLEDNIIAERTQEGIVNVATLLLYSTVCGTGLDTVPLPGDITVVDLRNLIYSVAILSRQLEKPLTARLMPIRGKKVGEKTGFNFDFFTNATILPVIDGEK
jgi:hypothetical protein